MTLLTLCAAVGSLAAEEPARTRFETASFVLPEGWTFQQAPDAQIVGMTARMGVALAPDARVVVYLFVIDPFGLDLEKWDFLDLLGPTLQDLVASTSGVESKTLRLREADCVMGGREREGRMVIAPGDDRGDGFAAGVACGVAEPARWAAAFVTVGSDYERPMLLRRDLRQADFILETFRFD